MRTEVASSHLRVTPGIPSILDVDVTNTADVIDGVTATIQGLDPAWVSLVVPVVSLFPDATSTLSLRIDLPTNCLAGEYLVNVHVASIIDADRFSDHEFWLSVEPVVAASLTMHPSVVIGGKSALFQAAIANEGNTTADLIVNARDETRILTCIANPATVSVPPGETHFVDVHVSGPRKWIAQATTRNVTIDVTGPEVELEARASFTQKPRIPRGVLTFLILASIIALWATVFLVVVSSLRNQDDLTKLTATQFNDAAGQQVDISVIGASVSGTVTAASTHTPVPRVTVAAMRTLSDGSPDSPVSTATDEDGAYTLEALLPGTYTLTFSGPGFESTSLPAPIVLAVAADVANQNVEIAGMPGTFSGQIVAPASSGETPTITLTIEQIDDSAASDSGEPPPPLAGPFSPAVDPATGNFSQAVPTTPADYKFTITSDGEFDPREFTEALGPGENKVINTVTLGAADGSISGLVTANGAALGGVEVTARSGNFEKKTTTPTSGDIGHYSIDGLQTPQDYVLTFSTPGFADQTFSVGLTSGQDLTKDVPMLGGSGTVTGAAFDKNGTPLGGVTLTVARGTFKAETSTLTVPGQLGSYSVTGLQTSGLYTFTFSLTGFDNQTVLVDLGGESSRAGVDVTLPRSNGGVTGVVSANVASGVTPTSGVDVTLTNGSNPRTTTTASNPAGDYRFNDIVPGSYTLTFARSGLVQQVVRIDVVADQITTRNITLNPGGPT